MSDVMIAEITAADAYIEYPSAIRLKNYNSNSGYSYQVIYNFYGQTGYVSTNMDSYMLWSVPSSFYNLIPNSQKGVCDLSCATYLNGTKIGTTSCQINIYTNKNVCAPNVTINAQDVNQGTLIFTGDANKFIKGKSTVECTVRATPINQATIVSISTENTITPFEELDGVYTGKVKLYNNNKTVFTGSATDSRGYSTTSTVDVSANTIDYIELGCACEVFRYGSTAAMMFTGILYQGSLGKYDNSLVFEYRWRKVGDDTYNNWITVPAENIKYYPEINAYHSTADGTGIQSFEIGNDFDTRVSYEFQIKAYDGSIVTRYDGSSGFQSLSIVEKTIILEPGEPAYDWGCNDINFNIDLKLRGVNILNIIYPVGSVYFHSTASLPEEVCDIGTWESISYGISGIYAWKRTS